MLTYGNKYFKITVDLPNGLYRFGNKSATGKTYLKNLMLDCKAAGGNVACIDRDIRNIEGNPELIIVDRFDAFPVEEELLKRHIKTAVVLVDTKRLLLFDEVANSVRLKVGEKGIHICGL